MITIFIFFFDKIKIVIITFLCFTLFNYLILYKLIDNEKKHNLYIIHLYIDIIFMEVRLIDRVSLCSKMCRSIIFTNNNF